MVPVDGHAGIIFPSTANLGDVNVVVLMNGSRRHRIDVNDPDHRCPSAVELGAIDPFRCLFKSVGVYVPGIATQPASRTLQHAAHPPKRPLKTLKVKMALNLGQRLLRSRVTGAAARAAESVSAIRPQSGIAVLYHIKKGCLVNRSSRHNRLCWGVPRR